MDNIYNHRVDLAIMGSHPIVYSKVQHKLNLFLCRKCGILIICVIHSMNIISGSLHTRAKSCDHEIVRAQRKCPKAVPTHLQNHVVWLRTLKCSVKSYVTKPSTKCYFNEFLFMQVLTHDKINRWLWCLGFVSAFQIGAKEVGDDDQI